MRADAGEEVGWLDAFQAGDPLAFGRLYDRYDRQCFRFIARTLGQAHADAAEDVHQDTWAAVAAKGQSFDAGKSSFVTWLFTIARNKAFDHLRRQKATLVAGATDEHDTWAENMPSDEPTPAQQVETQQLARAVVGAVESLPLSQRETFFLFAEGGLSLAEIAVTTEVGIETVKSRLRYARSRLRETLAMWRTADA